MAHPFIYLLLFTNTLRIEITSNNNNNKSHAMSVYRITDLVIIIIIFMLL